MATITHTARVRSRPLAGAPFGAEVEVDLHRPLGPEDRGALRVLLASNDVLVVRGEMSLDEQRRLCGAFARVLPQGPRAEIGVRPDGPQPDVLYLSNRRPGGALGNDELDHHIEFAYLSTPYTGLSLYAEDVGPGQAGTRFVSGRLAYERLPDALRRRIDKLQGLFVAQYDPMLRATLGRHRDLAVDPTYPRAVHPVVVHHPVTHDPVLYVTRSQTDRILGLSDAASEDLLDELTGHLYDGEGAHEHRYEPGDCVIWDNLTTQHARGACAPDVARTLRRVVFGERAPWEEWPYTVTPTDHDGTG